MDIVEQLRDYADDYDLASPSRVLLAAADEIFRLREALYRIIELDHHNMGPESKATKIARDALMEF